MHAFLLLASMCNTFFLAHTFVYKIEAIFLSSSNCARMTAPMIHNVKTEKVGGVVFQFFWLAVHGKPVFFWKGISGLKFPCFLFYACLLPEWRWEPVEFRAIPILLRKLRNIC